MQLAKAKKFKKPFAEGLHAYLDLYAARLGDDGQARERAIALLSGLVGALSLSRSIKKSDPELSAEILRSARKQLTLQYV